MSMLDSKLGCALQQNIFLLLAFSVILSETFGGRGNLGTVKYHWYMVHYFKKAMFVFLPVVSTHHKRGVI